MKIEEEYWGTIKVTGTGSKRKDVFPHLYMVPKGDYQSTEVDNGIHIHPECWYK